MSKVTRRQVLRGGVVVGAALSAGTAAVGAEEEKILSFVDFFLPEQLKKEDVQEASKDRAYTKLEFAKSTFWVRIFGFGDGVPHTAIGVYAPDKEGVFHRCLAAESFAAGKIEANVNKESGLLELRERAYSKLNGQLVLACNLRTIGTPHSIQ